MPGQRRAGRQLVTETEGRFGAGRAPCVDCLLGVETTSVPEDLEISEFPGVDWGHSGIQDLLRECIWLRP